METGGIRRRPFLAGAALGAGMVLAGAGSGGHAAPRPPAAPSWAGKVKAGEVSLAVRDSGGTGLPVVLLHSFTGGLDSWPGQDGVLSRGGRRVIAYARRGYRGSDTGPAERPGSGAGDLRELLDAMGISRAHLVATSGGSFVAVDFALAFPERTASLVMACSRLGATEAEFGPLVSHLSPPGFAQLPAEFRELGPSYRASDPAGVERWAALEQSARPQGAPAQQPYLNRVTFAALRGLRAPTLMIAGDADLIAPPPVMAKLAEQITHSRLTVFPACGHAASWEQPARFNTTVLDFLSVQKA
jgi:pimeloyl-ACP methyl ester carboxylesterase